MKEHLKRLLRGMVFFGIGVGISFIIFSPAIIALITDNDIWFYGLVFTIVLPIIYFMGFLTE